MNTHVADRYEEMVEARRAYGAKSLAYQVARAAYLAVLKRYGKGL